MQTAAQAITRVQITVSGIVQGIGYRPFIYNLALKHGLYGFVRNNCGQVEIEVEGQNEVILRFLDELSSSAPTLALIEEIKAKTVDIRFDTQFVIIKSANNAGGKKFISPDTATCNDCLNELFNFNDRRYRYPFINCTNCGPRFTIIKSLPFDRAETTMASFSLCKLCREEYENPGSRRFHAQANACFDCGPTLRWVDNNNLLAPAQKPSIELTGEEALKKAVEQLRAGKIIAVKGLGGFHLLCDATNNEALRNLRLRKGRSQKPLALMLSGLDMVRKYCRLSAAEEAAIIESSRPIVLLEKNNDIDLAGEIAPGIRQLGVMLPYTPLHYLITNELNKPLIATSANLSDEPIVLDNKEAENRLTSIADGYLMHNRDIFSRYDDSIIQFAAERKTVMRRSRGLAPLPLRLPLATNRTILSCGAHLKNTFCFIRNDQAFISQHIGNLESIESEMHFEKCLDNFMQLFDLKPDLIAHDLHPDYMSTGIARSLAAKYNVEMIPVQHHHAHIVSCMMEHGLIDETIGIAFDGLGYGADSTLWGGEFMLCTLDGFKRSAHFEASPMPGGKQAIKEPWRMILSYLKFDFAALAPYENVLASRYGQKTIAIIKKQIENQINTPLTSSCGRLFDAMAALLGICYEADYEGQAAMQLESITDLSTCLQYLHKSYPYEISDQQIPYIVKPKQIFQSAYKDILDRKPIASISAKFHCTIANIVLQVCLRLRQENNLNIVCLSGGVFQNKVLLALVNMVLSNAGFKVFFPQKLPANDGGISLGQAAIAAAKTRIIQASNPDENP